MQWTFKQRIVLHAFILALIAFAAISTVAHAQTIAGPCDNLAGLQPDRSLPSRNCVYQFTDKLGILVPIRVMEGRVDLYDAEVGTARYGVTSGEYLVAAMTVPFGARVEVIGQPSTAPGHTASVPEQPQTQPVAAPAPTPVVETPVQPNAQCPTDTKRLEELVGGDARYWSRPDVTNFPGTWVLDLPGDAELEVHNPGFGRIEYADGQGEKVLEIPGASAKVHRATFKCWW